MEISMSDHEVQLTATEALPCPFCGELPSIQPWHGGGPEKQMIGCPNLDCDVSPQVTGETRTEALENWNRRESSESAAGELTKDQISTLLYLETRAVDRAGRVNQDNLNDEDREWIKAMTEIGFLKFGRIVRQDCNSDGSSWVELSDKAWEMAARFRRERAERMLARRTYTRTCEGSSRVS